MVSFQPSSSTKSSCQTWNCIKSIASTPKLLRESSTHLSIYLFGKTSEIGIPFQAGHFQFFGGTFVAIINLSLCPDSFKNFPTSSSDGCLLGRDLEYP